MPVSRRARALRTLFAASALVALAGAPAFAAEAETKAETKAGTTAGTTAETTAAAAADPVIARLNGEDIRASELARAKASLPAQYQQMPDEVLAEPLLNQVIDQRLIAAKAEAEGLGDSEEAKRRLENARKEIAASLWLEAVVDAEVTEASMRAIYDKAIADMPAPEEVSASHILVATEDEAKAVIARLNAGEDFATLAQELSQDPGSRETGSLGWFTRERMVRPFSEAAFSMQPGEVSEPVQTQFGWHVIRVDDRREQPKPTFEELEPRLRQEASRDAIAAAIAKLREGADIEKLPAEGAAAN